MERFETGFPRRKHPRLKEYDYSQSGCYFVTVCTRNMACRLGEIKEALLSDDPDQAGGAETNTSLVGRDALIPPPLRFDVPVIASDVPYELWLSPIGQVTDRCIRGMNDSYHHVSVDKYVIMPNHFHLLIVIDEWDNAGGGMRASRPTLQMIVRSVKTLVTRRIGQSIWQQSFYERVVRNEREYQHIWRYIDDNPRKWVEHEKRITESRNQRGNGKSMTRDDDE